MCVGGWRGNQEAVFHGMELHHKKFDMKRYVASKQVSAHVVRPEMENV